jgi:hypothetical protein
MNTFIDLRGFSGAMYRFRLWADGASHPPTAGNYACVQLDKGRIRMLGVGDSLDLSRVRDELPKSLRESAPLIYTRLNVARATRTAEHEDLVQVHGSLKNRVSA